MPAEVVRRLTQRASLDAGAAAAYGRIGVSTQQFGTVCVVGGELPQHPHRQPRPARRRDVHEPGDRHRRPAGRRRAVTTTATAAGSATSRRATASCRSPRSPTRSSPRARVRSARLLTVSGNPVLSTPDGKRLDEALAGLDFMVAVDIYLNETTRHADVILPPTTALERDHYDLVFHALAVRNTARFTPAVLPKPDGARHDWEIFRDLALGLLARGDRARQPLKKRLVTAGPAATVPDAARRPAAAHRRAASCRCARCAAPRTASTSGPLEPSLPDRLQTKGKRIDLAPAARRSPTCRGCGTSLVAPGAGRAAADRPPAPAGLQLVDAQHPAAHQGQAPAPALHAPRRPRVPRARTTAPRSQVDLTRRQGHRRGAGDRRHDARRGVAARTATATHGPRARRTPRERARRLDQRPHRPRAARRQRQRGVQRRARARRRPADRAPRGLRAPSASRPGRRGRCASGPRTRVGGRERRRRPACLRRRPR